MVYRTAAQIDFTLDELPVLPAPRRVLLASPEHFDVRYVINPHMAGHVGQVDVREAHAEWEHVRDAYAQLGLEVHTVPGAAELPDMVFCANQTLPYRMPDGRRGVVLSRMHAPQRRAEVEHFAGFFEQEGYEVTPLPEAHRGSFEGMGDALWHPGRRLLWGGYGHRTELSAYEFLSGRLETPVAALRLVDPSFYHLDTCLSLLDERSALYYPPAFDEDGLGLLRTLIERLVEAPEQEALHRFACNAHSPDGRHVVIQRGCEVTNRRLREAGFIPVEVETGEFLKSGGSVFCMKLMYW